MYLLAQATRVPPIKSIAIVGAKLFSSGDKNLRLLRQARLANGRRPAARAPAHEALLRLPMQGLRADEARISRPRPRRPPIIPYWRCIARRRLPFFFLLVCRAAPALSSAAPGIRARSSACCSGRIACPRISQARWRRRRKREDHLVMVKPGAALRCKMPAKGSCLEASVCRHACSFVAILH